MALGMVIALLLGGPVLYFLIQTATRDPVLNSLATLQVPDWAKVSHEDKIIGDGSRWCFIDCRFRERVLISEGTPQETTEVYQGALRQAGWVRWEVEGCPGGPVDGDYTCWTRDEYTLDLWVHLPACAYDPRRLRPVVVTPDGEDSVAESTAAPADEAADECGGSIVEIKMQNRVADERGRSQAPPDQPAPEQQQPGDGSTPDGAPEGEPDAGPTPGSGDG